MCVVAFCAVAAVRSAPVLAQEPPHEAVHDQTINGWTLASDAQVFFGYNYQHRKFTDFSAWESQNWFMLTAEHPIGAGRLMLHGMASLEPFTLKALGSPQVFQTGETYRSAPLIDYQHPHDLIMGLGRDLSDRIGCRGVPRSGPTPSGRRRSARRHSCIASRGATILRCRSSHHYLDATHITPGVLRAGLELKGLAFETSVFRVRSRTRTG